MKPEEAVREVCSVEKSNEQHMLHPSSNRQWINPSKRLVDKAIERWNANNLRADNTSIVTGMLLFNLYMRNVPYPLQLHSFILIFILISILISFLFMILFRQF